MTCRNSIQCIVPENVPYFQLKSTSLKNDSCFRSLLNEMDNPLFPRKYFSSVVFDQVRLLDRLISQVEKNDMLRSVLARNIEGLIQTTVSVIRFVLRNFSSEIANYYSLLEIVVDRELCLKSLITFTLDNFTSGLGFVYNALVSTIVLSIVFQYLVGYVDKGGTKTYNPGSLEFRATFVSLLLFQGAYVWIKFREVAQRTVRRRHKKDKSGQVLKDELGQVQYYDKWEPRFKPPREKGALKHDYLPLGGFDTKKDAEIVCQIAGFYYGKDDGVVILEDGFRFSIPEILSEQERSLCGEEKRKWVSAKAREVFELFKNTAAREQAQLSAHAGDQVDPCGSPAADELAAVAFSPATTNGSDEFVERLSTPAGELGPVESVGDEEILFTFDIPMPAFQEELNEQLHLQKQQLEADFNRRLESLREQNAEHYRHLEVENSELRQEMSEVRQENSELREENVEVRQESKRLKSIMQEAAETFLCNLQD